MPATAETVVACYLYGAEPGTTAITSRAAQQRVLFIDKTNQHVGGATIAVSSKPQSATGFQQNLSQDRTQLTQADLAVAQLFRMQELDENWDGSGAAKPLRFSLADARRFIRALTPESAIPRATLHADGHAILFLRSSDTYAELEFLGNNTIDFYARRGGEEWSDEIHFDGHTLPPGLSGVGFET